MNCKKAFIFSLFCVINEEHILFSDKDRKDYI